MYPAQIKYTLAGLTQCYKYTVHLAPIGLGLVVLQLNTSMQSTIFIIKYRSSFLRAKNITSQHSTAREAKWSEWGSTKLCRLKGQSGTNSLTLCFTLVRLYFSSPYEVVCCIPQEDRFVCIINSEVAEQPHVVHKATLPMVSQYTTSLYSD